MTFPVPKGRKRSSVTGRRLHLRRLRRAAETLVFPLGFFRAPGGCLIPCYHYAPVDEALKKTDGIRWSESRPLLHGD